MHNKLKIKPGQRYGRLTVLYEVDKYDQRRRCLCKCDCGNTVTVRIGYLKSGHTKSCGCLRVLSGKSKKTHGCSRTKLYIAWASMLNRCRNKTNSSFKNYGGRGIEVCQEWSDFEVFKTWAISSGYKTGLSIERIDNNSGYNPSNCKFAGRLEQANNKRNVKRYLFNGQHLTISEWARKTGINHGTLESRIRAGWPIKKALTMRVRTKK